MLHRVCSRIGTSSQRGRRTFASSGLAYASKGFLLGGVVGVGIFGFLRWFNDSVATLMWVEGGSMRPVFNPDEVSPDNTPSAEGSSHPRRDVVLVRRWGATEPRRGEIVSLWSPSTPGRILIKRIVALDGDKIVPRNIYRKHIEEGTPLIEEDFIVIPDGHCWIEGDNAASSLDSNVYGPVPRALITGIVSWLLFPAPPVSPSGAKRKGFIRLLPQCPEQRVRLRGSCGTPR